MLQKLHVLFHHTCFSHATPALYLPDMSIISILAVIHTQRRDAPYFPMSQMSFSPIGMEGACIRRPQNHSSSIAPASLSMMAAASPSAVWIIVTSG